MKLQITLIALIGLTCATIAYGAELVSNQGSKMDVRSLSERANQMIKMREPTMHQLMNQLNNMQQQMTALHESLRRNHGRRNVISVRNVKDAFDEISRNFAALNSQVSNLMSSGAVPSTLGTRSLGATNQQSAAAAATSSSASSSAQSTV